MSLDPLDVLLVVRRLPKKVAELLKSESGVFLAGGFIRSCITGEPASDVDLFVTTADHAKAVAGKLSSAPFATENALSLKLDGHYVQVIHRWTFANPESCLATFDFTIAQAALWWDGEDEEWSSACSARYYHDVAAKRLVYTSPPNAEPQSSVLRLLKFTARGYRAPLDQLATLLAIATEEFSGSREERTRLLIGKLREVDPGALFVEG